MTLENEILLLFLLQLSNKMINQKAETVSFPCWEQLEFWVGKHSSSTGCPEPSTSFQLQVPGVPNQETPRHEGDMKLPPLEPSIQPWDWLAEVYISNHVHKVAGAVCTACVWEEFNTDGLSSPEDLGKGLATFFILHLSLLNCKETNPGSRYWALLTQLLLPSAHTPLTEAVGKIPPAKQHCGEAGFQIYWGWTHTSWISVLGTKKTTLAAGKYLSPHTL